MQFGPFLSLLVESEADDFPGNLALLDRLGGELARYPLADRRSDVMAARTILRERLGYDAARIARLREEGAI